MTRYSHVVLIGMLILTVAMASAEPPGKRRPAASSGPRDAMEALRALYVEVPEVKLDGLPLDEFEKWLARQTKVNVLFRWRVLEKEGIHKDTPVTLKLKQPLLVEVLNAVLEQVGEDRVPLGWRAADNIITVSTRADLDRSMVTKTYDVQDLLLEVPTFEAMRPSGLERLTTQQQKASPRKDLGADDVVKQLIDVITSSVFPNSWKDNGGSGTIKHYRGKLIIRNTPEVHAALRGELGLRDTGRN